MDLVLLAKELKESGKTLDFLKLVCDNAGLSNCSIEGPWGNVYFRPMELPDVGSYSEGHTHNFDHVSVFHTGKVLIKFYPSDAQGNKLGMEREAIYQAPCRVLIKANYFHEIVALEPNTTYDCVFAIRDSRTGLVSGNWDGSPVPYQ